MAVQNSDIESVLFLISVQANVNSRVQDASKLTPLHLAVQAGSEIIVRNLVSVAETLHVTCGPQVTPRVDALITGVLPGLLKGWREFGELSQRPCESRCVCRQSVLRAQQAVCAGRCGGWAGGREGRQAHVCARTRHSDALGAARTPALALLLF